MVRVSSLAATLRSGPWRLQLLHASDARRLIYVTHGQGRMLLGTRLRGVVVNNLIYVPPGQSFSLTLMANTNGHLITVPRDHGAVWPAEALHLRVRDVTRQTEISGLCETLQREAAERKPHAGEAMDAYARLIAVWLHRQLAAQDGVPERPTAGDRLLASFLADLERRFDQGLSMADFAAHLGVTPTHLTRVCKAQTGRSAANLLSERTLHQARHLLETNRFSSKSIAASLGFGSAAYFSRFIHAQTGQTPTELRKTQPGPHVAA